MNKIQKIRDEYNESLEKECAKQGISYTSLQKLLDAEKVKKLQRRNSLIQQTIDREIENVIDNEN